MARKRKTKSPSLITGHLGGIKRALLVEKALKAKMTEIEKFVSGNLDLSEGDLDFGIKPLEFKGFKITELKNIRTPIVRKKGEPEKISFELELELNVVVERAIIPSMSSPRMKVGEKAPPPLPIRLSDVLVTSTVEEQIIPWSVEVEAVVPADDTEYKNIGLSSILSKGRRPPSGLGLRSLLGSG